MTVNVQAHRRLRLNREGQIRSLLCIDNKFLEDVLCILHFYYAIMCKTLRNSCGACAKSKSSCDLQIPRVDLAVHDLSRVDITTVRDALQRSSTTSEMIIPQGFDPFDSHPRTRLPQKLRCHLE
ncbi:hypothetical protein ACN47E_007277 [Coniothyrium glycines]